MCKQGVFLASLMLLLSTAAFAQLPPPLAAIFDLTPNVRRGAAVFTQRCAECHGSGGNSVNPGIPRLAGQVREYGLIQLFILREGIRESTLMNPIAARLSDQDIADVTAYFSSQTPAGARRQRLARVHPRRDQRPTAALEVVHHLDRRRLEVGADPAAGAQVLLRHVADVPDRAAHAAGQATRSRRGA